MKLLTRTIRNYLIYSTLLVLIVTPVFYYAIRHIVVEEMDKVLISHKRDFQESLVHLKSIDEMASFPLMNKEFILKAATQWPVRDSLYTENLAESEGDEIVPHRVYRTGVIVNGKQYELVIRESLVSNIGLISSIMGTQFLMLGLLLAGLVVINRKLSKIIWAPFYVILERLKSFNIERDKEIILPTPSTAEFSELADAVQVVVRKNREVYENQKEFTENASHELQTPLAICRGKLELLAQTHELTEEQANLVESLMQATDRIARLNRDLLLLSKIENRQFYELEKIDIADVARKMITQFDAQEKERQLNVDMSSLHAVSVNANRVLVDMLISNLVSNAVRHTNTGGKIVLASAPNKIIISNTGVPLKSPDKIFERFQRNNATETTGNGLGLSIVKKICEVSAYTIGYKFEHSMHIFTVSFA